MHMRAHLLQVDVTFEKTRAATKDFAHRDLKVEAEGVGRSVNWRPVSRRSTRQQSSPLSMKGDAQCILE